MMKKITELDIQKKNKHRVSVYLDDVYAFGLDILAASSLRCGQELCEDKIKELKEKDDYSRALNSAIRFLGARARSINEMRLYLKGKNVSATTIDTVIEKLIKENYLNDAEFAVLWVQNRETFNPKGAWALRQELRHKGICDTDIDDALTEYDDDTAAWNAVEKKQKLWKNLDTEILKKKLYTFLGNRGFHYETANNVYHKLITEIEELS